MPDLLIGNVAQEDLDALDDAARGLGISRTEFVRRHLLNEARRARARSVTRADFAFVSEAAVDLELWSNRTDRGLVRITSLSLLELGYSATRLLGQRLPYPLPTDLTAARGTHACRVPHS